MFATERLAAVRPSASAMISQKAKAMAAAGEDVIDLGLGEPDFDTPPHIIEAAHQAALDGQTRYPPNHGTAALREAVVAKFATDNSATFGLDEVIACNGAKQVLFDAFMATLEEGDEVILCAPYFDSYANMIKLIGGVPVQATCTAAEGFRLTPEKLEAAITPKTRWLLLNAPSNPAGAIYSAADFQALEAVLERHSNILVLSDEIYEKISFDGVPFTSFAAACPSLRDRTLIVNGVSKAYAMTGWRIGYGAGPAALIKAMTTVQSQISSGACAIAQAAAAEALTGPQDCVETFRAAFERRRDLVMNRINGIEPLTLLKPGGAFYALIDCQRLIGAGTPEGGTLAEDTDIAAYFLSAAKVAGVPGSVYGTPGYFRISTAAADEQIDEALSRMGTAIAALRLT